MTVSSALTFLCTDVHFAPDPVINLAIESTLLVLFAIVIFAALS